MALSQGNQIVVVWARQRLLSQVKITNAVQREELPVGTRFPLLPPPILHMIL